MHELARLGVEGEDARLAAGVAREVERPEPPLAVEAHREQRLEVRRALLRVLELGVRERHRAAVHQLGELERRVAVGMQREEDATGLRDRDVARRIVEVGDHLQRGRRQRRRRRAVLEPPASSETAAEAEEDEDEDEQRAAEPPHRASVHRNALRVQGTTVLSGNRSVAEAQATDWRRADVSPSHTAHRRAGRARAVPAAHRSPR